MKHRFFSLVLSTLVAAPVLAQVPQSDVPLYYVPSTPARIEGMLRELPRADGPSLAVAIKLASAAVEACKAKGGNVSVLVTDSVGVPVVLLSGDGAGERSQLITHTKAAIVVKYRMSSAEVAQKVKGDSKLARELQLNPNIGVARGGAFPLMNGAELIGALSVSGLSGEDDNCAKEAMSKVPLR